MGFNRILSFVNYKRPTLTEIYRVLCEPQCLLIYLCENGIIVPNIIDTKDRDTRRYFSLRNLFEFSAALTLDEFHFLAKNYCENLRQIQDSVTNVKRSIEDFIIPYASIDQQSPEFIGVVANGSCLQFAIKGWSQNDGTRTNQFSSFDYITRNNFAELLFTLKSS